MADVLTSDKAVDATKQAPGVHLIRAVIISAAITLSMTGFSMASGLPDFNQESGLIASVVILVNFILFILLIVELWNSVYSSFSGIKGFSSKNLEKAIKKDEKKRDEVSKKLKDLKKEAAKLDADEEKVQKQIDDLEVELQKLDEKGPEFSSKAEKTARYNQIKKLQKELTGIKDKRAKVQKQIKDLEKDLQTLTNDVNNLRKAQINDVFRSMGENPPITKLNDAYEKLQNFVRVVVPYKNNTQLKSGIDFCVDHGKKSGDTNMQSEYSSLIYDISTLENQFAQLASLKVEYEKCDEIVIRLNQMFEDWEKRGSEDFRKQKEKYEAHELFLRQRIEEITIAQRNAGKDGPSNSLIGLAQELRELQQKIIDYIKSEGNMDLKIKNDLSHFNIKKESLRYVEKLEQSLNLGSSIYTRIDDLVRALKPRYEEIVDALKNGVEVPDFTFTNGVGTSSPPSGVGGGQQGGGQQGGGQQGGGQQGGGQQGDGPQGGGPQGDGPVVDGEATDVPPRSGNGQQGGGQLGETSDDNADYVRNNREIITVLMESGRCFSEARRIHETGVRVPDSIRRELKEHVTNLERAKRHNQRLPELDEMINKIKNLLSHYEPGADGQPGGSNTTPESDKTPEQKRIDSLLQKFDTIFANLRAESVLDRWKDVSEDMYKMSDICEELNGLKSVNYRLEDIQKTIDTYKGIVAKLIDGIIPKLDAVEQFIKTPLSENNLDYDGTLKQIISYESELDNCPIISETIQIRVTGLQQGLKNLRNQLELKHRSQRQSTRRSKREQKTAEDPKPTEDAQKIDAADLQEEQNIGQDEGDLNKAEEKAEQDSEKTARHIIDATNKDPEGTPEDVERLGVEDQSILDDINSLKSKYAKFDKEFERYREFWEDETRINELYNKNMNSVYEYVKDLLESIDKFNITTSSLVTRYRSLNEKYEFSLKTYEAFLQLEEKYSQYKKYRIALLQDKKKLIDQFKHYTLDEFRIASQIYELWKDSPKLRGRKQKSRLHKEMYRSMRDSNELSSEEKTFIQKIKGGVDSEIKVITQLRNIHNNILKINAQEEQLYRESGMPQLGKDFVHARGTLNTQKVKLLDEANRLRIEIQKYY